MKIQLAPLELDNGMPEESAAMGQLVIEAGGRNLTAGFDWANGAGNYSPGPFVSGYHLAAWLVWNWWRLRWEPRPTLQGPLPVAWEYAHGLSSVGGGYLWPNITIACDGFHCDLTAAASHKHSAALFRYLGLSERHGISVRIEDFEHAVFGFVEHVKERCDKAALEDSNLHTVCSDLDLERKDMTLARLRKFEAQLGMDPDEWPAECLEGRLKDGDTLGNHALEELAMHSAVQSQPGLAGMLARQQILDVSESSGFEWNSANAVAALTSMQAQWGSRIAWRVGIDYARALRAQEDLGLDAIGNARLADLAGVPAESLSGGAVGPCSWFLHRNGQGRAVLQSPWPTNRRFDLARLMGDRLFRATVQEPPEPMLPATRSCSYRQKAQRAFAAELLSPWLSVEAMLQEDYSEENQERVADHFDVSAMVIANQLWNNESSMG